MIDRQKILKDINKSEDKLFFAKALDRAYLCVKTFQPTFTYFVNPQLATEFLEKTKNRIEANVSTYGGKNGCERVMIGFFPEHKEIDNKLYPIKAIEVSYNSKYSKDLSHRDYLGSIMGMGITRERIGDIIIKESSAIILAEREIADYICSGLEKVGHTKVKCKIINIDELAEDKDDAKEMNITVVSLRIDCILSKGFNLSRGKASEYIKAEKVFLNWKSVYGNADNIDVDDIITARGLGRIKIVEILGKTKKDRFLIKINKYE